MKAQRDGKKVTLTEFEELGILQNREQEVILPQWLVDLNAKRERVTAAQEAIKSDSTFGTITAENAADYIETKVTDLPTAKAAMKKLARFIIHIRDTGDCL